MDYQLPKPSLNKNDISNPKKSPIISSRSTGNLPNQIKNIKNQNNDIFTSISNPSMILSYPSTSETNIFITPAIGRHKFVQGALDKSPKKSILKRPHSYGPSSQTVAFDTNIPIYGNTIQSIKNDTNQIENVLPRSPQKLTVGFSEKNTVAIFGDTSDDNTTETENDKKLVAAIAAANATVSKIPIFSNRYIRQTSILSSEDDTDSPSQPMIDSHENTPFDEDDLITEESDAVTLKADNNKVKHKDDDQISYTSSNASSIITGKWWFGKDDRYVVHCDKKGCNHKHSTKESSPGGYLTPTQVKNKEIARLKKELKLTKTELDEKELHLKELREHVKEIDTLIDNNSMLKENSKLMQRQKELEEQYKNEKKELIQNYDIKIMQLIQEAIDARADASRKTEQLENFTKLKREKLIDKEIMTEPVIQQQQILSPLNTNIASISSTPKPDVDDNDDKLQQYQNTLIQETVNQLQAYQNEAIVWRTKAAQLEIVVKEHLANSTTSEIFYKNELEQLKLENDKLKNYCHKLEASALAESIIDGDKTNMLKSIDSISTLNGPSTSSMAIVLASECQSPACVERTRLLNEENKDLIDTHFFVVRVKCLSVLKFMFKWYMSNIVDENFMHSHY